MASGLSPAVKEAEAELLADLRKCAEQLQLQQEAVVRRFAERLLKAQRHSGADGAAGVNADGAAGSGADGAAGLDADSAVGPGEDHANGGRGDHAEGAPPAPRVDLAFSGSGDDVAKGAIIDADVSVTSSLRRDSFISSVPIDTDFLNVTSEGDGPPSPLARLMHLYRWWMHLEEPKRSGILAKVVRSNRFELMTLVMIFLNGALVIYQTDKAAGIAVMDPSELEGQGLHTWHWDIIAEYIFAVFFLIELVLRVVVHRFFFFVNKDMWWNIFDLVTVAAGSADIVLALIGSAGELLDITFVRVIRLFRMTRVMRIFRALHFIAKLRKLIDSIVTSFSGVFWCLLLLVFITGIFATFLVQCSTMFWAYSGTNVSALSEDEAEHNRELVKAFGSVPTAMMSLFQATSGGNDWGYYYEIMKLTGSLGPVMLVMYILFFIIAAWNIVTSLFLESAVALAQPDVEEQIVARKRQDLADAQQLLKLIKALDIDDSGTISCDEFKEMMNEPRIRNFCTARCIDIKDAEMFFHMLESTTHTQEIQLEKVVNGLMRMRGMATNLDIQGVIFQVSLVRASSERCLNDLQLLRKELRHHHGPARSKSLVGNHFESECTEGEVFGPHRQSKAMELVQRDIASFGGIFPKF